MRGFTWARRWWQVIRSRSRRLSVLAGAFTLVLGPLGLAAWGDGYDRMRVPLSGGGAWLASVPQGLVTLVDGASEQVVGSVPVPEAVRGPGMSVVQWGSAAYVANPARGAVVRVDGGTYDVSAPVQFGDGSGSLDVLTSERAIYVLDGGRRVASVADPRTLRQRDRLSLAARPGPGQAVVDAAGRLWVVDRDQGGLTWFDGDKRVRPQVGDARSRLVLVQGKPALVDPAHLRVGALSSNGTVSRWSCLEVRPGDQAQVLGSTGSAQVYAAVETTGTLLISGVDRDDCRSAVNVGKPGDRFGPLVESAGFVFVPNWSSGETVVVDVHAARVAATFQVGKPGARLELLAKDGFVFYNQPDGDRAGVIRLDGGQWRLGKALQKFDRSDKSKGILTPAGQVTNQPLASESGGKPSADISVGKNKQQPQNNDQPHVGAPPPADDGSPGGDKPPTDPGPSGKPKPPVIRDITWSPELIPRGREATFVGVVDHAEGATWAWTLFAEDGSTVETSSSPDSYRHTFTPEGGDEFMISLQVTTSAGAAGPVKKHVQTTSSLTPQIEDLAASDSTPSVGQTVTFSATESVAGAAGHWIWNISNADTGEDVSGPQAKPAGEKFEWKFTDVGAYKVRLSVNFDGAEDEDSLTVNSKDRCTLTRLSSAPLDLRDGGSEPLEFKVDNCFVAKEVTIEADGWLAVSDTNITVPAGQDPGRVTVRRDGTPPDDGVINNAVTVRLVGGDSVQFDVRVNIAPKFNNYAVCVPGDDSVWFYTDFTDADLPGLDVTLRVGGLSRRMEYVDGGSSGHGEFWALQVPESALPSVSSWHTRATDSGGLTSDEGTGQRGSCW